MNKREIVITVILVGLFFLWPKIYNLIDPPPPKDESSKVVSTQQVVNVTVTTNGGMTPMQWFAFHLHHVGMFAILSVLWCVGMAIVRGPDIREWRI